MRLKRDSLVFLSGGTSTTAAAVIADNVIVRGDGGARGVQGSVIVIADTTGAMSGWTTGAGLTMHGGGTITGASGSLDFVASGTNQSITLTPSGTGFVIATNANTNAGFKVRTSSGSPQFALGNATVDHWIIYQTLTATVQGHLRFRDEAAAADRMVLAKTTGNLLLGGLTTDGTGVLQFPAATTSAGGITFGTDVNLYRTGAGTVQIDGNSFAVNASGNIVSIVPGGGNGNIRSGNTLVFQTNGANTALTLDSSQNATFAGTVITLASATAKAGLRLPHGAAPTSPVDGDMWTTSAGGLFVRINGVTKTVTLT